MVNFLSICFPFVLGENANDICCASANARIISHLNNMFQRVSGNNKVFGRFTIQISLKYLSYLSVQLISSCTTNFNSFDKTLTDASFHIF